MSELRCSLPGCRERATWASSSAAGVTSLCRAHRDHLAGVVRDRGLRAPAWRQLVTAARESDRR